MVLHDVEEVYTVLLSIKRVRGPGAQGLGQPAVPMSSSGTAPFAENRAGIARQQNSADCDGDSCTRCAVKDDSRGACRTGATRNVEMEGSVSSGSMTGGGGGGNERLVRRQDTRRRKLRQVFLRGDNVVMVTLVENG